MLDPTDIPDPPFRPDDAECDACSFLDPVGGTAQYDRCPDAPWLCELCAGTPLPNVQRRRLYTSSDRDATLEPLLQAILYAANTIRRDLRPRETDA